ncbi:MAG: helicase HerA domain-containing protein, partial [Candidatus Njordarchaeia archaeon]
MKGNELGIVVSHRKPPTHLSFIFQLNDDIDVKVGEFVEVPIGKYVLVGRIVLITAYNEYLENPEFIRDHMQRGLSISARFPIDIGRWRAAKVEIIAMFSGDRIHPPNIPPEPGEMVYRAGTEVLRKLLGIREDGLFLGTMYGNSDLKVKINPESLVRLHFAVFGTTGSGKSYTVGVLVEELLEKNFPVVIIDPHGEYFTFREKNDDMSAVAKLSLLGLTTRGYPTQIFYPSYGGSGNLSLNFSQLNTDAIAEMANLTPVMRDLLYLAMRNLRDSGIKKITPDLLLSTVNEIAS